MKIKVQCECGIIHIIKIPFKLRKKIEQIDLHCFNCNSKKSFTYLDFYLKNDKRS